MLDFLPCFLRKLCNCVPLICKHVSVISRIAAFQTTSCRAERLISV
jgi:hypothetical protein